MAELFFPQPPQRRQPPDLPVGVESRNADLAARAARTASDAAGSQASAALQRADQAAQQSAYGFGMVQASAEALVKYREIERREQLVIQETRAGHALTQAKQAAQNEIDLYLTSPDSPSHTNPEDIPQHVGAILQKHGAELMGQIGQYDAIVQENAGAEFQAFGQGIVPEVRKEKTVRVRDQALAGASEYFEVQKAEFFRARTPEDRQRIVDGMLGRMELLKEQGFVSAQDEENFQITLGKELVRESIAEMRRTITLDTPPGVVSQIYANIEATTLTPKEKEQEVHALNSHMSYLLNQDAHRRNLESQARKQQEEAAMKEIVMAGVQGGDWTGAMELLNQGLQSGVIDTTTYLQRRDQFLKMQSGGGRKHSDRNALMQAMVMARQAGSPGSPVQNMDDWMRAAAQFSDSLTPGDLKSVFNLGLGEIEQEAGREQRASLNDAKAERKQAYARAIRDFKAWYGDTVQFQGLPAAWQGTAEDSQLVAIAQGRIERFMEQNPDASGMDIDIFADQVLLENDKVVQKLFREKNPRLYDQTIGIGITTVQGLDAELAAGRITQDQRNDLAEFIVFRDKRLASLEQQPPGTTPGIPGMAPKPKPQQGSSQDVLKNWWDAGTSWIGEQLQSLTPQQQQDAKKKAEGQGLGSYFNKIWGMFGSGGTGGAAPPRPPQKQE